PYHNGGHKVISTYLKSLDVEERRDLKLKGIKLPPVSQAPLFNYSSLIRHLDYGEMLYAVEVWCSNLPKKRPDSVVSIMRVLLRLFLNNAGPLSSLKLATLGEDYNDEKCMILTEPEIKNLITSVRTLSLDGFDYNQQGLLTRLPDLCQNVDCGPWEGLASCMKLKNLEFWFCKGITHKMIKPLLGKIFSELEEVKLLQYGIGCEEFNYWANKINGISSTSNSNICTVVDEFEFENNYLLI
ncbi:7685_t:CDS:2, partial [Racocetra fulgida]